MTKETKVTIKLLKGLVKWIDAGRYVKKPQNFMEFPIGKVCDYKTCRACALGYLSLNRAKVGPKAVDHARNALYQTADTNAPYRAVGELLIFARYTGAKMRKLALKAIEQLKEAK